MVFIRGKLYGPDKKTLESVRGDLKNTFSDEIDVSEVRPTNKNDFEILITIVLREDRHQ